MWNEPTLCARLLHDGLDVLSVVPLHSFLLCDLVWEREPLVCALVEALDLSVLEFALQPIK